METLLKIIICVVLLPGGQSQTDFYLFAKDDKGHCFIKIDEREANSYYLVPKDTQYVKAYRLKP